mgnify:CR=1 FL=1
MENSTWSGKHLATTIMVALALVIGVSRAAHAVAVTACDTICTTNCDLTVDLDCAANAVTLANGADFDFNGHTIGCSFAGSCGGSAVLITGNNSIVKDSGGTSGVKGGVRAGYVVGIDCSSKAGSQVTEVYMDGVEGVAIKDCSVVDHNTLVGGGEDDEYITYAIERNIGISPTNDSISDNYISWFGRGIKVVGNKPAKIEHNTLVIGPGLSPEVAIYTGLATSSAVKVRYNTILSEEDELPPLTINAANSASFNYCDETKIGCASCIGNGACQPFEHAVCGVLTYPARIFGNGALNQADTVLPINFPLAYRYMLVMDYPDIGTIVAVTDSTLLQYTGTGIGIGQDLFKITMHNVPEGTQFESCTLRSHMIAEGTPTGYSPTWLTVRRGGVQSDGAQINVLPTLIREYTRVMATNPITNQPWNSDELAAGTFQIGVKNNVGSGSGVGFTDLLFECQ